MTQVDASSHLSDNSLMALATIGEVPNKI